MSSGTVLSPPGVIYAICDPRTNAVRYVGKTCDFRKRVKDHRNELRNGEHKNAYLQRWYNKLLATTGKAPTYRILQECLPGTIDECEREWIARGRAKGWRLCNFGEGGEGGHIDDAVKAKLAEITRDKFNDPEYVRRFMEGQHRRFGLTPEKVREREARRAANREQHARNMALAAQRQREKEAAPALFATLTPLTCRGVAFVPLTRGQWAMIDVQDWPRVSPHRWSAQQHRGHWRAKMNAPKGEGRWQPIVLLSRFVVGAGDGELVAFGNGNTLDCRRRNLSIVKQIWGRPKRQVLMAQ